jgi:hypothetical protein
MLSGLRKCMAKRFSVKMIHDVHQTRVLSFGSRVLEIVNNSLPILGPLVLAAFGF